MSSFKTYALVTRPLCFKKEYYGSCVKWTAYKLNEIGKRKEGEIGSQIPGHKIQDKMRITVFKRIGKKDDFGYEV